MEDIKKIKERILKAIKEESTLPRIGMRRYRLMERRNRIFDNFLDSITKINKHYEGGITTTEEMEDSCVSSAKNFLAELYILNYDERNIMREDN